MLGDIAAETSTTSRAEPDLVDPVPFYGKHAGDITCDHQ